jgi:hypothetical protein
MRRITTTLALALFLLGCDSVVLPWDRVQLLTDDAAKYTVNTDGTLGGWSCGLMPTTGDLIADPTSGTAYKDSTPGSPNTSTPAMWLPGYTGRRVGSEVEVLDRQGKVVATTGKRYRLYFVYVAGRGGATDDGKSPYVICDLYPAP